MGDRQLDALVIKFWLFALAGAIICGVVGCSPPQLYEGHTRMTNSSCRTAQPSKYKTQRELDPLEVEAQYNFWPPQRYSPMHWPGPRNPDMPVKCKQSNECGLDAYCAKADGHCDAVGVCEFKPKLIPKVGAPTCGCNGENYDNEWRAAGEGINVKHYGWCEEWEKEEGHESGFEWK